MATIVIPVHSYNLYVRFDKTHDVKVGYKIRDKIIYQSFGLWSEEKLFFELKKITYFRDEVTFWYYGFQCCALEIAKQFAHLHKIPSSNVLPTYKII